MLAKPLPCCQRCIRGCNSVVPKKARHCGHAGAMLMSSFHQREKDLTSHQVRIAPRSRIVEPAPEVGRGPSAGSARPVVTPMSEVTRILSGSEHDAPHAVEQLLPLVYEELRKLAAQKLAQEKPGQTLEATALVHEAYLRLVDASNPPQWNGRGHFFAAAAEAMRRILVEQARRRAADKRGGDAERQALDLAKLAGPADRKSTRLNSSHVAISYAV